MTFFRLNVLWFLFFACIGLVKLWVDRFMASPDFVSYTEIAYAYLQADWHYALNSAWPPLFSWLLMIPISLTNSPESEIVACHVLQYVIFLLSLATFALVIRELLRKYILPEASARLNARSAFVVSVYWLVGGGLLVMINPVTLLTPDTLQFPIVFLLLYLLVVYSSRPLTLGSSVGFAAIIAIGYYAKSVFIPLAPFLILSSVVLSPMSWKKRFQHAVLQGCVVFVLVLPFVAAISNQQGRLTFGDSGKINYGLFVYGLDASEHQIYSFANKNLTEERLLIVPEKYPYHCPCQVDRVVWEDPTSVKVSFFDMGIHFPRNLKENKRFSLSLFVAIAIVFFAYFRQRKTKQISLTTMVFLLLPAAVALAAYAGILPLPRYVHLWLIWILFVAIAGIFALDKESRRQNFTPKETVIASGLFIMVFGLFFAWFLVFNFGRCLAGRNDPNGYERIEAARRISQLDVHDICVVAGPTDGKPLAEGQRRPANSSYYPTGSLTWIVYTPCRIRAVYPQGQHFYSLSASELNQVVTRLEKEGIDTILFKSPPKVGPSWTDLGDGNYVVRVKEYRKELQAAPK